MNTTENKTARKIFRNNKKEFPTLHTNLRDEIIRTIIKSETPNWGGLKVIVTKNGI